MKETDVKVKRWGDSIAVIIPKEVAEAEKIKPMDRVHLVIKKEYDLMDLFGRLKTKKTPQQLKDESRKDWQ